LPITAGALSSSAAVNDMVVRSINCLILQSEGGGYEILIDSEASNNFSCSGRLTVNGDLYLKLILGIEVMM
jgi:hypothetical protein